MSSEKKKKVYFCGSIRAGRGDVDLYGRLVSSLQETHGCRVLTPFVGDPAITPLGSEVEGGDRVIHDRDLQWLREADAVVAEVTQPSLGVGYEIGRAVDMKKKILCLYRPQEGKKLSAMIRGIPEDVALVVDYKEEDVDDLLREFLKSC